jgi:hypothetical protein
VAHLAPTDKNSVVYLIRNLKTRLGYNVTCNPCKLKLNTKKNQLGCTILPSYIENSADFEKKKLANFQPNPFLTQFAARTINQR